MVASYRQDQALRAWAKQRGLLVRIDIYTPWGNPWHPPRYERTFGIQLFRERRLPKLLPRLEQLRGKVLVCHCYPLPCHGDVFVEALEQLERPS